MKKWTALFLAVLLVFCMTACAPASETNTNTDANTNSGELTREQLEASLPHEYVQEKLDAGMEVIIAYSATTFDNAVAKMLTDGWNEAFTSMGFTYIDAACENDTARQVDQIENFISMKCACILITAGDSSGLEDVITRAEEAGIYCVYYGGMPEYSLAGTANIDLVQLGEALAKTALAWVDLRYPDAGPESIKAASYGYYIVTETGMISSAMRDTLDADPRVQVVYEDNNCQGIDLGFTGAESAYTYDSDIRIMLFYDPTAAMGASNFVFSLPNADPSEYGVFCINYSEEIGQMIEASKNDESVLRGASMGDEDVCRSTIECVKGLLFEGVQPQYNVNDNIFSVNSFDYVYEYEERG